MRDTIVFSFIQLLEVLGLCVFSAAITFSNADEYQSSLLLTILEHKAIDLADLLMILFQIKKSSFASNMNISFLKKQYQSNLDFFRSAINTESLTLIFIPNTNHIYIYIYIYINIYI